MFAVKRQVLEELFKSRKWTDQLLKARNFVEVKRVLREFAKEKGYKVEEVKVGRESEKSLKG